MNPYNESCAFVNDSPKHVSINDDRVEALADALATKDFKVPAWREPVYPESDDGIIEFFGVINAINFCFTDFSTGKKFDVEYPEGSGKIWTGAFAMTAAMKRAVEDGLDITEPNVLYNLSQDDAKHIFRHFSIPIPMLEERLDNLRLTGYLIKVFHGSFKKLFESCSYKLISGISGILRKLALFESYNDTNLYRGQRIYFCKRAQLFPMMYHGRALSSSGRLKPVVDPENFGPLADYEVPKILRYFGVLLYSEELARKVDNGEKVEKSSSMEIEIRAQTVNAMSMLFSKINQKRLNAIMNIITMVELDYAIWGWGRSQEFMSLLHHYTYTRAY